MFSIRKINPLARAIGTMGAVLALVGGVTYAALQTNTAVLADNELTSGTPLLQVGTDAQAFANSVTGIHATLTPGIPKSFKFYLQNNDTQPLTITANVPTGLGGSQIPANKITLALDCGGNVPVSYTLDQWASGSAAIPGTVAASSFSTCHEVVTLDSTYSQSGQTVTPYDINFVGNE